MSNDFFQLCGRDTIIPGSVWVLLDVSPKTFSNFLTCLSGPVSAGALKVPLWFSAAHSVALPSPVPFCRYGPPSVDSQLLVLLTAKPICLCPIPTHPFSGTGNFGCENIKAVSNLGTQRAHPTVSTSQASMSFIAWYSVLWNWFSQHLVVKGLPWICKALGVQSPALERKKTELLLDRLSFVFESFWLLQAGKQLLSLGLPSYVEAEVSKETRSLLWGLRTAFT